MKFFFITQSNYSKKIARNQNFGGFDEIQNRDFQNKTDRRQPVLPEVSSTKRFDGTINDDVLMGQKFSLVFQNILERFRFEFLYHYRYLFPISKQFDSLIG